MSCDTYFFFFFFYSFFFQAEDGIRDSPVTGVQTCALPISDLMAVQVVDLIPYGNTNDFDTIDDGYVVKSSSTSQQQEEVVPF